MFFIHLKNHFEALSDLAKVPLIWVRPKIVFLPFNLANIRKRWFRGKTPNILKSIDEKIIKTSNLESVIKNESAKISMKFNFIYICVLFN